MPRHTSLIPSLLTTLKTLSVLLTLGILGGLLLASPTAACVGPPPEPFCTKTLQLAIAGPPVILLPAGGTFEVSALVYFGLLDFPAGFGICPMGPYTVDIDVTATCTPGGANGFGQVLAAPLTSGYNELTVPVTVPAGPPRRCVLSATATLTLADGMVLTEDADNLACLGDPAPGMARDPRLDLRLVGPPGSDIDRAHPGDPSVFVYEITNNDGDESFIGLLTVDSLNESRQPGFSGPMPTGTAVVSISDPVEGDNFTIGLSAGPPPLTEGGGGVESCLPLPADPLDPTIPSRTLDIDLGPGESTFVTVSSRSWGMCADGSCGRSTIDLAGLFSDATSGRACSGFVTAADTSVDPTFLCGDSGQVVSFPPPPEPVRLISTGKPKPDVEVEIDHELINIFVRENGIPTLPPLPFSDTLDSHRGRLQMQAVNTFDVDSFFDIDYEITISPGEGGDPIAIELIELNLTGAPSGFDSTAPFVSPRLRLTDQGGQTVGFYDATLQVHAVGIDNLGERRLLSFNTITFTPFPDGNGLRGSLGGGTVSPGPGNRLDALEIALDLRGFLFAEPPAGAIFTDGFESGNVTRWSASSP